MGKILVVDDQFGVRSLLVSSFQDDDHEVKMAANGETARRQTE
jgi:two-component system response regulator (stage 0 sporulation protein F)